MNKIVDIKDNINKINKTSYTSSPKIAEWQLIRLIDKIYKKI